MLNSVLVVWREAFEAILIVGILLGVLSRRENYHRTRIFLWMGVGLGLVMSAGIGYAIQHVQTELDGRALDFFDSGLLIVAALLMAQMCLWMKRHGRTMKSELESGVKLALSKSKLIGLSLLAALAVAREGAELVIFFYGMGLEARESGVYGQLLGSFVLGVALSAATAWAYFKGLKFFKPRVFFQITSLFLLLTASSLLLSGVRKLIQMEVLSPVRNAVWDTSFLLDGRSWLGQFANTLFGYEATPSLSIVITAAVFWVVVLSLYFELPQKLARSQNPTRGEEAIAYKKS